jgi:hypothetical protein
MSLGFVWIGPISLNFVSIKTCSLSLGLVGINKKDAHKNYVIVRSTTNLKKAKIQIKGINERLNKIKFDKQCLYLPKVKLYDWTKTNFRNLVVYEHGHVRTHCFCAFKRLNTNHGRPYQEPKRCGTPN